MGSFVQFEATPADLFALRRRDGDLQNAIPETRVGLVSLDALGQLDRTEKAAVAAFTPEIALLIFFVLPVPLATDRKHVVRDFHVDVVPGQPGKLRPDHETVTTPQYFDRRRQAPIPPCEAVGQ